MDVIDIAKRLRNNRLPSDGDRGRGDPLDGTHVRHGADLPNVFLIILLTYFQSIRSWSTRQEPLAHLLTLRCVTCSDVSGVNQRAVERRNVSAPSVRVTV